MGEKEGSAMAKVGRHIKALRTAKGMTQDDLAQLLFVSRQTISNYETGKSNPDIDTLVRLAQALDTDPNALIYGPPVPQSKKREIVGLCVAAGVLAVLLAAMGILLPMAMAYQARTLDVRFTALLAYYLWPCILLLLGWTVMQALALIFGWRSLNWRWLKAAHWAGVGVVIAYFFLMGPWPVFLAYARYLRARGGGVGLALNLGPVWNGVMGWLMRHSAHYRPAFAFLGIFLRATRPARAPKQVPEPEPRSDPSERPPSS
jgi:transcriptional regulator with XRE-family HTH domain